MIKAICTSCKDEREFRYIGRQDGFGEPDLDLYNCMVCTTTLSNITFGIELIATESIERIKSEDDVEYIRRKTEKPGN